LTDREWPINLMWIESENGTLYNINWIQSIRLDPVADGGWVIKAQFALHNPPGNAGSARPHLVTTTLKKFALEHEAEAAFETLKDRMGDIIQL